MTQIAASFCAANQHSKGTEVGVAGETRRNIGGKKRVHQEDVDSDYLSSNFLQLPAFRSRPRPRYPSPFSAELPDSSNRAFFGGNSVERAVKGFKSFRRSNPTVDVIARFWR